MQEIKYCLLSDLLEPPSSRGVGWVLPCLERDAFGWYGGSRWNETEIGPENVKEGGIENWE